MCSINARPMPWGSIDYIFIMIDYSFRHFPKHNICYFEYAFTLNQCWKCEQREKQQIRYLKWGRWRSSSAKSRRHIFCFLRSAPEKLLIWGKRPQSARSALSARVSRKMQSSGCKHCPHCPGGVHTYSVVHRWYIITRGCIHWEGHSCTQFGLKFQPWQLSVAHSLLLSWVCTHLVADGASGSTQPAWHRNSFTFIANALSHPDPKLRDGRLFWNWGGLHCRFFSPINNWMCHM